MYCNSNVVLVFSFHVLCDPSIISNSRTGSGKLPRHGTVIPNLNWVWPAPVEVSISDEWKSQPESVLGRKSEASSMRISMYIAVMIYSIQSNPGEWLDPTQKNCCFVLETFLWRFDMTAQSPQSPACWPVLIQRFDDSVSGWIDPENPLWLQ